jgi:hypothetical protein
MFYFFTLLFFVVVLQLCVCSYADKSTNNYHILKSLSKLEKLRGGSKKKTSAFKMFQAFWMTLIDPRNDEYILHSESDKKSNKKSGFFKSKQKGRSLKN